MAMLPEPLPQSEDLAEDLLQRATVLAEERGDGTAESVIREFSTFQGDNGPVCLESVEAVKRYLSRKPGGPWIWKIMRQIDDELIQRVNKEPELWRVFEND
jgi:hypothetical protein